MRGFALADGDQQWSAKCFESDVTALLVSEDDAVAYAGSAHGSARARPSHPPMLERRARVVEQSEHACARTMSWAYYGRQAG